MGASILHTTEGEGTLTYYLKDSAGLVAEKTLAYKLDQTAPVIGTLTYDSTQTFWDWIFGKDNIQVTVPVADALSGTDHITYALTREGGSAAAPVSVAVSSGKATFDVSKEFKGDISITAYDKADNESAAVTTSKMAVEDTAPALTAKDAAADGKDFSGADWYTTAQTCDFSAQEGEHTYHITVTDNALNSTTVDVTIKQDSEAPAKHTLAVTTAATDTTITLKEEAADAISGVASYTLTEAAGQITAQTSDTGVFALTGLTPGAAYTFTWYKGSAAEENKLNGAPSAAGTYVVVASMNATDNTAAASVTSGEISISPAALTITAKAQTIDYGESIATGVAQVDADALAAGDTLTGITLTASGTDVTENGTISPDAAVISGGAENYTITYKTGKLVITPVNPKYTVPTGLTATYGETLADVTLPTAENGKWSWNNGSSKVGNVGTNTFTATFTPDDSKNYNTINDVSVLVTVAQADPAIGAVTYTGGTLYDSMTAGEVDLTRASATVPGTLKLDEGQRTALPRHAP